MKATGFFDDETQLAPPRTIRIDFDDGSFALRSPVAFTDALLQVRKGFEKIDLY